LFFASLCALVRQPTDEIVYFFTASNHRDVCATHVYSALERDSQLTREYIQPAEGTGTYLNGFTTWSAPSVGRPGTSSE
jgi:hypothetical protein